MGKGDKKTRRGKIIIGTYGVRRPKKKSIKPAAAYVSVPAEKAKKETQEEIEEKEG